MHIENAMHKENLMSQKQTSILLTDEELKQIELVAQAEGIKGMGATLRYCLRQVYKQIRKESA